MSDNALDSQGMLLKIGDGGSPENFSTIPEITSIQGPGGSANEIDVTDLNSTAKEFRMGLQDEGQITLEMAWIPTNPQHKQLRTDRANQTKRNFELHFTDTGATSPTIWSFAAFVQSISISNGVDDVTRATVTLRLTGAISQQDAA